MADWKQPECDFQKQAMNEAVGQQQQFTAEGQLNRVQKQNKQKMYKTIEQQSGLADIQQYKQAYRKLYYEQGLFQVKKSRDFLEKCLQDVTTGLHYNQQGQLILKAIAKVYLIQLFEQAVQVRQQTKRIDIDENVLDEAARQLRENSKL